MTNQMGETDLEILLKNMQPVLEEDELVFCCLPASEAEEYFTRCQGYYVEREGITVIVVRNLADRNNLTYGPVFRRISLMVHSSLEAVGFLARIAEILAAQGISVNVVSAFYHDHLYLKEDQAENALEILELWQKKLSESI